jgi:hypothetical protein
VFTVALARFQKSSPLPALGGIPRRFKQVKCGISDLVYLVGVIIVLCCFYYILCFWFPLPNLRICVCVCVCVCVRERDRQRERDLHKHTAVL